MTLVGPASHSEWDEFFKEHISRANLDHHTLSLFHDVTYHLWKSTNSWSSYLVDIRKGCVIYRLKFVFDNNTTCHFRLFRWVDKEDPKYKKVVFSSEAVPLLNLYKFVQEGFPYPLYPL